MSAFLEEVNKLHDTAVKQKELRERMQVLEGWKACAANGFEREMAGQLSDEYKCQLDTLLWEERFPGKRVPTDGDDPNYWREKGRELRAEGEGRENMGNEAAWPHSS